MPKKNETVKTRKEEMLAAVAELNKIHGENTLVINDERTGYVNALTSGSLHLDRALGIGGYPIGRCMEFFGKPAAGKSLLSLTALREVQLAGGIAVYLDLEHGYDKKFAQILGVDTENLVLSQPDYLEQGLEIMLRLIEVGDAIVFDSVAGCPTKKELEEPLTKDDMGIRAKKMTRAMTQIAAKASNYNCTCFFINQFRESLSLYTKADSPGGNAIKHHASIRLQVRQGEKMKRDNIVYGYNIEVEVIKNKVAAPFGKASIPVIFDKGISRELEVLDLAVWDDIVTKAGSWYSYGDVKLGQGAEKAILFLEDNPELFNEINNKLK